MTSTDTHSLQGPREWTDPNPEERKFLHWKSGNRAGRMRLPCPVERCQELEDIDKTSIKLEKRIVAAKKILELEMRNAHSQGLGIEVWTKTTLMSKPPGLDQVAEQEREHEDNLKLDSFLDIMDDEEEEQVMEWKDVCLDDMCPVDDSSGAKREMASLAGSRATALENGGKLKLRRTAAPL